VTPARPRRRYAERPRLLRSNLDDCKECHDQRERAERAHLRLALAAGRKGDAAGGARGGVAVRPEMVGGIDETGAPSVGSQSG
jgi:hypothetical protein